MIFYGAASCCLQQILLLIVVGEQDCRNPLKYCDERVHTDKLDVCSLTAHHLRSVCQVLWPLHPLPAPCPQHALSRWQHALKLANIALLSAQQTGCSNAEHAGCGFFTAELGTDALFASPTCLSATSFALLAFAQVHRH